MSFKDKLKKVPVLYPVAKAAKNGIKDMGVIPNHRARKRVKHGQGPAKVGFLCQFIPVWHKLQPIYEMMRADSRFEPYLLCVPSNVKDGKLQGTDYTANDTLDYFHSHGFPEALNALQPDGSWLDLQELGLAYIFYPRPYDSHMPACYHSCHVSRYCKICMIMYGMNIAKEIVRVTLNRGFFRNTYCYFAEVPFAKKENTKLGWLLHMLGIQHSVYFGMPGVEAIREAKGKPQPAWAFSKNDFRVMWTPRWTTDLSLGGSNFFTYYQFLLDYAQTHPDYDFLFRPHPLALQHFMDTGEMTQQEADAFLEACQRIPNVSLDQEKEYTSTFWGASVLVSDFSGVVPEFASTGLPLIFCASNMVLTLDDTGKRILESNYVVNNAQELQTCLEQLKQGIDPKKEKRAQMVQQLFGGEYANPAKKIVEYLAEDFAKHNK